MRIVASWTAGAALGLVIGMSGAIAGDYGDKLIFGSVSSFSLGNRDVDSSNEGTGQTWEFSSTSAYNIPLWKSFSMQVDTFSEYYFDTNSHTDPNRSNALGLHLSYRNPNQGLIGLFGAYSWTDTNGGHGGDKFNLSMFGAEAQLYQGNWTFYVQGGIANTSDNDPAVEGFHDGWFARGVVRYFFNPNSKVEAEVSYAKADTYMDSSNSGQFTAWGVSFDHKLTTVYNFPVYGTLAYRGAYYDSVGDDHLTEHVFKAGIKVLFGARDLLQNDRNGATLDLPTLPIRANGVSQNVD